MESWHSTMSEIVTNLLTLASKDRNGLKRTAVNDECR